MKAAIKPTRSSITGRFIGGFRLIADGGYWVGPGLGNFRSAAEARNWAARNGYSIN